MKDTVQYQAEDLNQVAEGHVRDYIIELGKQLLKVNKQVMDTLSRGLLDHSLHDIKPGDWIYIKSFTEHPGGEKWKGPYQTLLTTHTAVKAHGITTCLRYCKIKKAPAPKKSTMTRKAEHSGPTSVRVRR